MVRVSRRRTWIFLAIFVNLICVRTSAQGPAGSAESTPGQVISVIEPITNEQISRIRAEALHLLNQNTGKEKGTRPILVFEFLPGETAPGSSEIGVCYDLASFISRDLAGAKLTVAFVPKPLTGYAVLPAVACTEIVMGSTATLGPITPEGQLFDAAWRDPVRALALRNTRDPDLLLGMLDRDADLRLIRTADKSVHYVLATNVKEFLKSHQVIEDEPAWEGGQRGILTAARARQEGFCKRIADSPAELASMYQMAGHSTVEDPTLGQTIRPAWIKLDGPLDTVMVSYLTRSLEQARQERVNLLFLQINSTGGIDTVADSLADLLYAIKDMKTVAYISDRATGVAALLPLACRDIVFTKTAQMGEVRQTMTARNGHLHDLSELQITSLAKKAALLAREKGHSEAVAVAMVDPNAEVLEAKDSQSGATKLILRIATRDRARTLSGAADSQGPRFGFVRHGGGRRFLWPGSSRGFGRGSQRSVWTARTADPDRRARLGRYAGHDLDRSLCELAAPVCGCLHAGRRAQAARNRAARHRLRSGIPPVLLEPLPQRHRRSTGNHPVLDRARLPGSRSLCLPRFRHFRHERRPADAVEYRDGQPYVHLADPRLRVPRVGIHLAASHRDADCRGRGRGHPGPIPAFVAVVQSPGTPS